MKIAAGCFGCLTLVFLALSMVFTFAMASLVAMLSSVDPGMASDVAPLLGYVNWATNGCCCLSGALSIILFAVGMSRGNNDAIE